MARISDNAMEIWTTDIDSCDECQDLTGENVCPAHDLDDPNVRERYAAAAADLDADDEEWEDRRRASDDVLSDDYDD
jgi:hypothetical protein